MSHSPVETLIKMINQIAANNRAYEDKEAAERHWELLHCLFDRTLKKQ